MKIIGGSVFGTDHKMHHMDLCFENGVITEKSCSGEFDASGCYVLPGLIDTHVHGAYGVEFYMSDDHLAPALDFLAEHGVTGILASIPCATVEELEVARETTGKEPLVCGSCLSDLSVISKYGSSRAFGFGAGRDFSKPGGAHQPDEYIECDKLVEYTKTIAAYILKILG